MSKIDHKKKSKPASSDKAAEDRKTAEMSKVNPSKELTDRIYPSISPLEPADIAP